jgi:hypothetical protein
VEESRRVADVLAQEDAAGLERIDTYRAFGERLAGVKLELLRSSWRPSRPATPGGLWRGREREHAAQLLRASTRTSFSFAVDRSPHKQGLFLPVASHPHSPA